MDPPRGLLISLYTPIGVSLRSRVQRLGFLELGAFFTFEGFVEFTNCPGSFGIVALRVVFKLGPLNPKLLKGGYIWEDIGDYYYRGS